MSTTDTVNTMDEIAIAVEQAEKAGVARCECLAIVDLADPDLPVEALGLVTNVTTTPSGRRYGRLSLGAASDLVIQAGIEVIDGWEVVRKYRYSVSVDIEGKAKFDVMARSAEEARELAEDDVSDLKNWVDLDYHFTIEEVS